MTNLVENHFTFYEENQKIQVKHIKMTLWWNAAYPVRKSKVNNSKLIKQPLLNYIRKSRRNKFIISRIMHKLYKWHLLNLNIRDIWCKPYLGTSPRQEKNQQRVRDKRKIQTEHNISTITGSEIQSNYWSTDIRILMNDWLINWLQVVCSSPISRMFPSNRISISNEG